MNETRDSRRAHPVWRPRRAEGVGTSHGAGRRRPSLATTLGVGATGTGRRWTALIRWAAGLIFLIFGVAKFSDHAVELASFRHYALPAPDAFVYLVGVIEIGGAVLLAIGLLTRLTALALAADMVGAIAFSGLGRWELVSLTLAPLLLVAMVSLIRFGAGRWSIDRWMALNRVGAAGIRAHAPTDR